MKNNMNLRYICYIFILWICASSCENKEWDKHYGDENTSGEQITILVDAIRGKGYTAYAAALEKIKLDPALNTGMSFTIFVLPDTKFNTVTQGKTDDQIRAFLLNSIIPGTYMASDFVQSSYQPIAGEALNISMKDNTLTNMQHDLVKVSLRDIKVLNSVLFELTDFLPQYPDLREWLKANGHDAFLEVLNENCWSDSTTVTHGLGTSATGLVVTDQYPEGIFYPESDYQTGTAVPLSAPLKNLVFVVPDESIFKDTLQKETAKIKALYMDDYIQSKLDKTLSSDGYEGVRELALQRARLLGKNAGTVALSQDGDYELTQLSKSVVTIPLEMVKGEVKLRYGNKVILADTIFQSPWNLASDKKQSKSEFGNSMVNIITEGDGFSAIFDKGCNYVGISQEQTLQKEGDKVTAIIPSINLLKMYSGEYEVDFCFQNGTDLPTVIFYANDQLLGEVDMTVQQNTKDDACGQSSTITLPASFKVESRTQPVVITLEVIKNYGKQEKLMAPFSVSFKLKQNK